MSDKLGMVDNKMINEISEKIWSSFNILRGEISSDDFHLVLFLLTIKRMGFKSEFFSNSMENQVALLDFLSDYDNVNASNIIDVYGVYDSLIYRLPNEKLIQLYFVIDSIDSKILDDNFLEIFDYILYKFLQSLGKFSGEFILPIELSRFMINIANLKHKGSIYNPFAGATSFGVLAPENSNYIGQEINQTTWVVGVLRLLATNSFHSKSLILGDSIKQWNPNSLKYDLIIASPPFGMRLPFGVSGKWGTIRNFENFAIEKGLDDLKNDGKLVILVPESFLFSSGQIANLRYHLIDQDLIESVISFPNGILHHTAIKTSVLVINKSKKNKGFINFIIADDFVINGVNRSKILKDLDFVETISKGKESSFLRKISIEEVKSQDRVLDCQRYFLENFDGVKLNEFVTRIRGQRFNSGENGKWVKIKDLKDDNHNFYLDVDKVEEIPFIRQVSKIEENCILISKIGRTLKPTFFEFSGESIYINDDILALRVDKKIALPIFVVMEFYKDYVVEQANSFRKGAVIPFLKVSDILSIKFDLPNLLEQQKQLDYFIELTSKLYDLEQQRDNLKSGFKKYQFDEFASLKHSLGAPRQNILSNSKTLIRFFENDNSNEFKVVSAKFFEHYGIELQEVFNQFKNDINQISTILEKGENGLLVNDYKKELISLFEINKFINGLSDNGFNFKIRPKPLSEVDTIEKYFECNLTLLKILFDNIFTNANKYAFDSFEETNEVVIELALIGNQLEVSIKNNGRPFPKKYSKEKFISKFSTNNTNKGKGIGGYDINRIAAYFENEDWTIDLNTNPLYPVVFKFLFPIKNSVNEQ
ncbi:N-6 DNA methylase [Flavobacterium sp. M31R6]|uniref:N-6 DNA methylase n=1 Tax=Flavobacterium sp. M31R6 TaxID=2739062 RepID=UPI00156811E4|nr:N-6 DNA methylase [Flavobacterium sp. M31R6]QKJ63325.1 N-6 DNA methylase [Flavobacterium sp. M31R6]